MDQSGFQGFTSLLYRAGEVFHGLCPNRIGHGPWVLQLLEGVLTDSTVCLKCIHDLKLSAVTSNSTLPDRLTARNPV